MHKLKESQVNRQFFLGNAVVRAQPRAQQRPEALHRVDMHFVEVVAILVAGILPSVVANTLAYVFPLRQGIINRIFVGVDHSTRFDSFLDKGPDGFLSHILQHYNPHLAP